MKRFSHHLTLDNAFFIMILAVPCILSVAVDVDTVTEKAAVILAQHRAKDVDAKIVAQAKNSASRPDANVR